MTLGGSLTLNCYPDNLQINMYRQAVSHNNLGTLLYRVSEPAEDLKIRMGAAVWGIMVLRSALTTMRRPVKCTEKLFRPLINNFHISWLTCL